MPRRHITDKGGRRAGERGLHEGNQKETRMKAIRRRKSRETPQRQVITAPSKCPPFSTIHAHQDPRTVSGKVGDTLLGAVDGRGSTTGSTTAAPTRCTTVGTALATSTANGGASSGTGWRSLAALLPGLDGDPGRVASMHMGSRVTALLAYPDTAFTTLVHSQRRDDGLLGSIDSLEFEESASLGSDDIQFLDGTEASFENSLQLGGIHCLNDTLEENSKIVISAILDNAG